MSKPTMAVGRESRLKSASYQLKRHVPHVLYSIFRYAFIIGMAYVLLYPILIMASRALRPAADMTNPSIVWIPTGFTFENLQIAWRLLEYPTTLIFTTRIVIISTLLSLISCSMAGYALARYRLKLSGLCSAIAILTIVVPMQTYIIPLFTQMHYFTPLGIGTLLSSLPFGISVNNNVLIPNLTGSEWCYYVAAALGSGLRSGLFIIVFMNFFKGMPKELEDAARVDGCSELRTFVQVMIPNAGAPFLVVTLFSIVWYWNDYYFAQMMMSGRTMLSTKIAVVKRMVSQATEVVKTESGLGETVVVFAAALLFIIPPLLLYLYLQKYFVQSIERTGIVG
ncbi:MAG: carbohydrate ABC transporter permease [Clostridia bacterium]|nr:carbohydrate ABC transporter permease [Clostridia bacterium]